MKPISTRQLYRIVVEAGTDRRHYQAVGPRTPRHSFIVHGSLGTASSTSTRLRDFDIVKAEESAIGLPPVSPMSLFNV